MTLKNCFAAIFSVMSPLLTVTSPSFLGVFWKLLQKECDHMYTNFREWSYFVWKYHIWEENHRIMRKTEYICLEARSVKIIMTIAFRYPDVWSLLFSFHYECLDIGISYFIHTIQDCSLSSLTKQKKWVKRI